MSRTRAASAARDWHRTLSKKTGCVLCFALALSFARSGAAQSAADKATARQLATQGIQNYQQGKNAEALDLLQKAEQLYDAPVHLIYIARAQAALGKLVEASETYRRLTRLDLPAGAPQAFKDAVADAQKELPQLEPRIPSLRIDVIPADAPNLKLRVDGEVVSTVIIGINRPTNPGKHTIVVSANGYEAATATVDLVHAGKQTVSLRMKQKPGAVVSEILTEANGDGTEPNGNTASTTSAGDGTQPRREGSSKSKPAPEVPFDRGSQIVVGIQAIGGQPGGTVPLGRTDAQSQQVNGTNAGGQANTTASVKDRFGSGGGVDLRVGYRLALGRRFALTPMLGYQYETFDKGKYYSLAIGSVIQDYALANGNSSSVLQITPTAQSLRLGAVVEFPMPSKVWMPSYYAELSFVVSDTLKASGTLTTNAVNCTITDKFGGRGFKLGLGVLLPAAKVFRFNAGIGYMAISTTSRDYTDNCGRTTAAASQGITYSTTFGGSDQKVHSLLMAGIGGDLLFGL